MNWYSSEAELESTSLQIEGLRADKAMNDKIRLKLEEAMNRAEDDYRKALDEMPSAWNLIGMQVWLILSDEKHIC